MFSGVWSYIRLGKQIYLHNVLGNRRMVFPQRCTIGSVPGCSQRARVDRSGFGSWFRRHHRKQSMSSMGHKCTLQSRIKFSELATACKWLEVKLLLQVRQRCPIFVYAFLFWVKKKSQQEFKLSQLPDLLRKNIYHLTKNLAKYPDIINNAKIVEKNMLFMIFLQK